MYEYLQKPHNKKPPVIQKKTEDKYADTQYKHTPHVSNQHFFNESQSNIEAKNQENISKPNNTGIPTSLKDLFEKRSGLSLDDVNVHYNSDKPAQFKALAYTQGNQIYCSKQGEAPKA